MKKDFWKADWFFGLVITIVVFGFARTSGFIPGLERWAYDLGVKMTSKTPSDRIAVIAIDEQSIDNIGRWPWPRDVQAKLIDKLAAAKAKVIGSTIIVSEPEKDPGLAYVDKMIEVYNKAYPGALPQQEVPGVSPIGAVTPAAQGAQPPGEVAELGKILAEASVALNNDVRLAASVKQAGNVLVPMTFRELSSVPPPGKLDKPLPEYVSKNKIGGAEGSGSFLYGGSPLIPIEKIGNNVAGVGFLNTTLDEDGAVRFEPLVIDYFGEQFPSLSVMIAAKALNLTPKDIKAKLGESVSVGGKTIRTDDSGQMYTYFYKDRAGAPAFPVDSFYDVYKDNGIPAAKYANKIVLIGATAAGVGASQVTPISPAMAPVQTLAHSVSSIMQEHFFVAPTWGALATLGAFLLIAAYLVALLPRLTAGKGAIISGALLVALFAAHLGLMTSAGLWIQLMLPAALLVVGHAALTTKRYLVTERGKEAADVASAESNRMLGLAFQQQGQLDMAFDKFRKAPLNDEVMENMYALALDFERRRQFNKAESVFRYMSTYNPKFRDIEERLGRNKQLSETIILGGSANARTNAGTMILQGGAQEKPMLGRYQVEKELGKGAMGVVYGGKDPKIGRVVAIKTMALSAEFEADELTEAKERFFREAETAGRLTHPNIVTIYDAGEEHDLCYIAMEFLKGKDLVPYTKQPNLFPPDKVLSIIERVADALGYAHTMGIVHRDIKPANIMYEPESDTAKVTDFGIARITDSSRTKTGMVLGTPSYMSPEQLAGKRIDGRSDLFSLGVTLYQMLSGRLPFEGESMTQLMFAIANNPHPPIREFNPALPAWVDPIIDKALAKDFEKRYQTGTEFAQAIREARKAGAPAAANAGD